MTKKLLKNAADKTKTTPALSARQCVYFIAFLLDEVPHETFVGTRAVGQLGARCIYCRTRQVPVLPPFVKRVHADCSRHQVLRFERAPRKLRANVRGDPGERGNQPRSFF